MLVVSNIDLTTNLPIMKPSKFLESSIKDFTLNINNDYRYLKTGYYVSLHAEVLGNTVVPSSLNIIDAYRTPILLLRASKARIPTMPYLVTDSVKQIISEFNFPVAIFAVNPFSHEGFKTARNRSALYRAVKSLSVNYKFDVCAQPLKGEIVSFNSIFGRCDLEGEIKNISQKVYEAFKIPICRLHVQRFADEAYLSGLQPLESEEIRLIDRKILSEEISEISKNGELLVG